MSRARNDLIIFERLETAENEYGEEVEAWSAICEEWAQVFYGRGDERRQAAMERAAQPATFQVESNASSRSVRAKDRIVFDGEWDIQGVAPDTPRRGTIEFTATRQA